MYAILIVRSDINMMRVSPKTKIHGNPTKRKEKGMVKRRQEEGERLHVPLAHLRRVDTNNKSELVYRQN